MSEFTFSLRNYHAISSAEIRLDGVTVIAGKNGCGKSTIARWLYAFVRYSNEFEDIIDQTLLKKLNQLLRRMLRTARYFDEGIADVTRSLKDIPGSSLKASEGSLFSDTTEIYSQLAETFEVKLNAFTKALSQQIAAHGSVQVLQDLSRSLNFRRTNTSQEFVEAYADSMREKASQTINLAYDLKQTRNISDLYRIISEELDCGNDVPRELNFTEGEEDLISLYGKFFAPFGLDRAIYVDTPMALSNFETVEAKVWKSFRDAVSQKPVGEMPATAKKTLMRLQRVMGGNVSMCQDEFGITSELRYVRREDGLDIPITEAATGVKTFAYMQRLLENGWLTDSSLLLIDEPEAHLHPQWIVEFARILVMLNKEVGTKIVLASHDPDMIAAIQSISEAQGTGDNTHFYQAEPEADGLRYRYNDLGNSVEEIFRSFNIALDRIRQYGADERLS